MHRQMRLKGEGIKVLAYNAQSIHVKNCKNFSRWAYNVGCVVILKRIYIKTKILNKVLVKRNYINIQKFFNMFCRKIEFQKRKLSS